jgi:hypothetical protein
MSWLWSHPGKGEGHWEAAQGGGSRERCVLLGAHSGGIGYQGRPPTQPAATRKQNQPPLPLGVLPLQSRRWIWVVIIGYTTQVAMVQLFLESGWRSKGVEPGVPRYLDWLEDEPLLATNNE